MNRLTGNAGKIVDGVISNYFAEYINEPNVYVADQIMRLTKVSTPTVKFATINKDARKQYDAKVADGTLPNLMDFAYEFHSVSLETSYLGIKLGHDFVESLNIPGNENLNQVERTAARMLADQLSKEKEVELATMLQTSGNWGTHTGTPGTLWDVNGDFVDDVNTASLTVQKATGLRPNTFVCSRAVFEALKQNTTFTNRNFLTGAGLTSEDAMKSAIGALIGMKVIIAEGTGDSAKYGQTASNGFLWGKDAFIMFVAPNASLGTPTFGLQPFMHTAEITVTDLKPNTGERNYLVTALQKYALKVTDYELGYQFDGVIS